MEITSIEDLVRTSDHAAVRRRFDQRNVAWLTGVVVFFIFVVIAVFGDKATRSSSFRFTATTVDALLVIGMLFIVRELRRARVESTATAAGRTLQKYVSALVVTFLVAQYTLCLAFTGSGFVGWLMAFPWFVLGFRLLASELLLIHGYLIAAVPVMVFTSTLPRGEAIGVHIGALIINAICLSIELYSSRQMRKEIVSEWTERRAQAREQIRMRDELQVARELQLAMLPECAPKLDWLDICAISVPATEVGGDYYDYFVEDGRVALVCGDVAGHGLASGIVLASLRSGFTLLRDSLDDPAQVMRRLHDLVAQTSRRRMLATVAVVLLDRHARRATIASAGHPPVLVRRDGDVRALELFAPPLGVRLPVEIPQITIDVAPGDLFILHSDGIYEARNDADEVYGLERLAAFIAAQPRDASAEEVRDALVADVDRFRGDVAQGDDATVVVARVVA